MKKEWEERVEGVDGRGIEGTSTDFKVRTGVTGMLRLKYDTY